MVRQGTLLACMQPLGTVPCTFISNESAAPLPAPPSFRLYIGAVPAFPTNKRLLAAFFEKLLKGEHLNPV